MSGDRTDDDLDDLDLPAPEPDAVSTGAAADSADTWERLKTCRAFCATRCFFVTMLITSQIALNLAQARPLCVSTTSGWPCEQAHPTARSACCRAW
jgi:hypothetical protein